MLVLITLVFCLILNVTTKPISQKINTFCSYESCHFADPTKLNVHIVPHSHDDVGWLKTIDQYYYGEKSIVQNAGVQYIIDSIILSLNKNPDRRFIQVETAFFHKWWNLQSNEKKEQVKKLVNNGQLEFVGGGWSMNDEATVHYQSIIDQFTLGLRTLNDTFGECARPKVGWQIDPFGHSREMASIFAQMGFDGLFFSRLDWRDKTKRLETKTAEIIWKGSQSIEGNSTHLFTSVLYNHYSAPEGFCFDVLCWSSDRIVDDAESPLYNLKWKVAEFANFVRKQADYYRTNNIIITMGDDFHYQEAGSNFLNMDRLIHGFKRYKPRYQGKIINLFYSTPSCYVKAVHEASLNNNLEYSIKEDDFLPYATDYHTYWSGYYTSRPTSKRYERQGNNLLQVVKQLASFREGEGGTKLLKQIMGVMQHHDAITGTEKSHVWNDYHRLLHKAIVKAIEDGGNTILKLISPNASSYIHKLTTCLLANMTVCSPSNQEKFLVIVYNPLSRRLSNYVRLPVNSTSFKVTDLSLGEPLNYQVAKAPRDFSYTELDVSKYEIVFLASDLPPLGFKVYEITNLKESSELQPVEDDGKYFIENEVFTLNIDKNTGKLSTIIYNKTSYPISQELMYYRGFEGNNEVFENRSSGAYIFRPLIYNSNGTTVTNSVNITTYKGLFFEEVHQHFNAWLTQVIRIYRAFNENYIEFDWIVGPIDDKDSIGKEVISRFTTDLNTNDIFYTDSNGREMLKRKRNYRSDYEYSNEEPVSGNYYPVTSRITLKDEEKNVQLSLLNDRAQGGSSLKSGELELMLHRLCMSDDGFGVEERLNETEFNQNLVVRGQLYLTLSPITGEKNAAVIERELVQRKLLAPWVFLNTTSLDSIYDDIIKKEFSGITKELPLNVHLLTLEPLDETTLLIRLEHIFEKNEDIEYSQPVTIQLTGLFKYFEIISLRETTLAADRWIEEVERLQWVTKNNNENGYVHRIPVGANFTVTLSPMEIRTFVATIERT